MCRSEWRSSSERPTAQASESMLARQLQPQRLTAPTRWLWLLARPTGSVSRCRWRWIAECGRRHPQSRRRGSRHRQRPCASRRSVGRTSRGGRLAIGWQVDEDPGGLLSKLSTACSRPSGSCRAWNTGSRREAARRRPRYSMAYVGSKNQGAAYRAMSQTSSVVA